MAAAQRPPSSRQTWSARGGRGVRRRRLAAWVAALAALVVLAGPAAADPPVLTAPPAPIEATGPNGATVDLSGIATDDNGTPAISCSPASGSIFPLGSTPVSCTLTDTTTSEVTNVTFNVIVVDTTPPAITGTPANTTVEGGASGAAVSYPSPTATDTVDGTVGVTCAPSSGTTFPVGTTTVTCTATDSHGNTSHASFTVTVQNIPPTITGTPANLTSEATSSSGATVSYASPTATDSNGTSVPVTCQPTSGSTFPIATTTVICTATDSFGNTAQSTFTVMVQDTTPPTITGTPASITVQSGPSGAGVAYTNPTATDTVDGTVPVTCSPASGTTFAIGTTAVTCTATDAHGNKAQTSFTVTVADTPPTISGTPANMNVEATSSSGATVTYPGPSATDAGGSPVPVSCQPSSGSTFPTGTTTVTCTATDANGNTAQTSFTVTVQDTTPPVISVPGPLTASAVGPAGTVMSYTVTATDAVDGAVTPNCTPASGATFPLGTTTVTCTATDKAGNSAAQSFTVTVADTLPPVLHVPGTIAVQADGVGGGTVTFSVTAVDAIDGSVPVTCSPASGATFPVGTTTVSCSAKDSAGNSASASFVVSVTMTPPPSPTPDRTPPAITVPTGITVPAQSSGGAVVVFSATAVDVVDGTVTVTCSPVSGSVFAVGRTTVRCSAQDSHGNAAMSTFTVDVLDRTPPPAVVGLTVHAEGGRAMLRWQNPSSPDIDHIEVVRTKLPSGSPVLLHKGMDTSYTDAHVRNGAQYRYTVFTVDASGNRSGLAVSVQVPALALVRPADGAHLSQPPVLLWVPAAKADYYNVQLYRNGSKVLSVWPSTNHFTVSPRWTFERHVQTLAPGAYRWFVWPGYGRPSSRRFGALLGSSGFVVTG